MLPELEAIKAELESTRAELERLVTETPAGAWTFPSPNPGWSCRDLLAHIASGDWVNQGVVRAALDGRDIAEDRRRHNVDGGNAQWQLSLAPFSAEQLMHLAEQHRRETLLQWEELTEEHLAVPIEGWRPGMRELRDYLHRFPNHERTHVEQLRQGLTAAVEEQVVLEDPAMTDEGRTAQ